MYYSNEPTVQHFVDIYNSVASTASINTTSAATSTGSALALTGAVTATTGPAAKIGPNKRYSQSNASVEIFGDLEIVAASGLVPVQFTVNINYAQSLSTGYAHADSSVRVQFLIEQNRTWALPLTLDNDL